MEHVIKTLNLTDEKDLSLERLDSRVEFLAAATIVPLADCGLFICNSNTK